MEAGLHYRDKSSSMWRVIQTCGNIGYEWVAQERVHNTKHESQGMGEGMGGLGGGWEQRRDFGRSEQKVIKQGTVVSQRYWSDQREWRLSG